MSKTKKCDQCNKKSLTEDTFVFDGKSYCMGCLYPLIVDMAESGNLYIDSNNCEDDGLVIHF